MAQIVERQQGSDESIAVDALEKTDIGGLISEVERYLSVVTLFRGLDCEPTWSIEWPAA